jgi:hypothetical protein
MKTPDGGLQGGNGFFPFFIQSHFKKMDPPIKTFCLFFSRQISSNFPPIDFMQVFDDKKGFKGTVFAKIRESLGDCKISEESYNLAQTMFSKITTPQQIGSAFENSVRICVVNV